MVKKPMAEPVLDDVDDELRLLGRIAAGVAHDLNNYLAVTDATFALLDNEMNDVDVIQRGRASVDQARRLTASLVSYVRGEAPPLAPVDLGALVDRTLALVSRILSPDIELRTDIAAQLPVIAGAAAELEQLVLNLVLNAADAMPDGGELAVRVQPTGGPAIYLEVSDTGGGISSCARIGADGRTASTKAGRRAGLGLGIVRRVIDRHGGSLKLAPRIGGPGTIAWVLLPTG
jgi:signal transduction histidine kinase